MGTPRRYKTDDELSTDDLLAVQQAQAAGKPTPRFERDAYKQARADTLREGGFDAEADEIEAGLDGGDDAPDAAALEAMEPGALHDHLNRRS